VEYLLGMDAGGTKTVCAVADSSGNVLGTGRAGCGNFQSTGRKAAQEEIRRSIEEAVRAAGIRSEGIAVAFYGISGADRAKDFATVREMLEPINPARRMYVENDTIIALRAGTVDGVGVGLISGTGTNAVGLNRQGKRKQVGGWGSPFLGDYGSAHDIAATGLWKAQRGHDGRGEKTILYDLFLEALGLEELVDICEWNFFDSYRPFDVATLAPVVFDAARQGDSVAVGILAKAGRSIGRAALAVLRDLFGPEENIPVVLGGSVFQKGNHPAMIEPLKGLVAQEYPGATFVLLDMDPVLGALFYAFDKFYGEVREPILAKARECYECFQERARG